MIDHDKDLRFKTIDDGIMVGDHRIEFCDSLYCAEPAKHRVVVSVNEPHDATRNLCDVCHNAYMIGVQHGRHHEAARHGAVPGRGSSQEPPETI